MQTSGRLAWLLALGAFSSPFAQAQATSRGAGDSAPAGVGFSIESEMLTYRALETNSEAIACDVAAFLNKTTASFTNSSLPKAPACDVRAGSQNVGIVLLPFDKSAFADFQMWRDDMAKMERLEQRADRLGCPTGETARGAAAAASSALNLTPAGPMLNAAQGVLGLLASEETTSPVTGTIQDQALMNGVGRQLRALKMPVIMPTGYSPYSLEPLDEKSSPFLANLYKILHAEGCLKSLQANGSGDSQNQKEAITETISEIDKFRSIFDDVAGSDSSGAKTPAASTDKTAGSLPATPSSVAPASSSNHLLAVLFADGLAQKLGVDATGKMQDGTKQHILLVKALESGGSVSRNTNVLGTKIRYSGGFVGTYALFTTDGDLECSGNVYDFGGSIKAKNFQRDINKYKLDPSKQMIFQRGGCSTSH